MTSDDAPPTPTATERVTAALASGQIPCRRDVEHSLRECWNISSRQAKRFASEGVKALGHDEAAEMLERIRSLELAIQPKTQ
jgi:hypothetical protein